MAIISKGELLMTGKPSDAIAALRERVWSRLVVKSALKDYPISTAGLDPEERNRFLNLLSEIGEQVVVILSTHIVDDVADLCPRMAIISKGELLMTGKPSDAIAALRERVWSRLVVKSALKDY